MILYPTEAYLDEPVQTHLSVTLTGVVDWISVDSGDGRHAGPAGSYSACDVPAQSKNQFWAINDHTYASPGTYHVTATVRVRDCAGGPPFPPPAPPFGGRIQREGSEVWGGSQDTSVDMILVVRPDRVPPAGPPLGP